MTSVYAGSSLASLSIILCSYFSWQITLLGISIVSGVLSLFLGLCLKDPRNTIETTEKSSWVTDAKELIKNRTLVLSLVALFLRYSGGFARGFFAPLYFTVQFPKEKEVYAICNAVALCLTPISLYLTGKFTDRREALMQLRVRPVLCCITSLVPLPFIGMMFMMNSLPLAMASLFIVTIVGETYISVSLAMIINVTTPRVRALRKLYIESGATMAVACIGGTSSALVLGVVNSSQTNLRIGLVAVLVTCYILGGLVFYLISLVYPQDYKTAREKPELLIEASAIKNETS